MFGRSKEPNQSVASGALPAHGPTAPSIAQQRELAELQQKLPINFIDQAEVFEAEKQNKWYEIEFSDTQDPTKERVFEILTNNAKGLADYCQKTDTYFVMTVAKSEEGTIWTVMPGQNNKQFAELAAPLYRTRLTNAFAHVIIGPSGDSNKDSEDIGVMDANISDCTYAFDVTSEDGIACDALTLTRNTLVITADDWQEWDGHSALRYAEEVTSKNVVLKFGNTEMIESMKKALAER